MSRWFRFYDRVLDDPKVQKLPDALFKAWVNLLCLASRHDGILPPEEDVAFALRIDDARAVEILDALAERGLLDAGEDGLEPHNWRGCQHKSDSSAERVARHRQKKKGGDGSSGNGDGNGACNVTPTITGNADAAVLVTPQNRTEQKRAEQSARAGAHEPGAPDRQGSDELGSWLRTMVGEEPVLQDLNIQPIADLLASGRVTRQDVENGIREAMADLTFRIKRWKSLVGWIEAAAAKRLEAVPKRFGTARPVPKPIVASDLEPDTLRKFVRKFQVNPATWLQQLGPRPDEAGCTVPPEILAEFGFAPRDGPERRGVA